MTSPSFDPTALAREAVPFVFRTDLDTPGFIRFDLGIALDPVSFRTLLIATGRALAVAYHQGFGGELRFVSVSRFDQQAPTRPHRDGGPDASILLLGYEPTEVISRLFLLDYTRAAQQRGLTPAEYLDAFNPALAGNERLLEGYTSEIAAFTPSRYQIVIVNNSCLPVSQRHLGMLGVLHQAVIPRPRPECSRPIDSVLMGITSSGLDEDEIAAFVAQASGATR